jgi:hypothetical protein
MLSNLYGKEIKYGGKAPEFKKKSAYCRHVYTFLLNEEVSFGTMSIEKTLQPTWYSSYAQG